jgi:polar amino acid transport system permease protein
MWDMLSSNIPFLMMGAWNTFYLSVISMGISVAIGFAFGLMRLSSHSWVKSLSLIYIEIWRGVPMIVTMLLVFFAFPVIIREFAKVSLSSFDAMLISCVLWTSANAAEIVRGAVQSIPFGQTEASMALGMSYINRLRLVILPQAIKIMIPPMIGLFTLLLKGTAIGFIIEYRELIRMGQITIERLVMSGHRNASIEIYGLMMVMYFFMCYPLSRISAKYEKRLSQKI